MLTWLGFIISLTAILLVARRSLPLALFLGAVILGLFTLPAFQVLEKIVFTVTDVSVLLLALAMGVIPMIGGTMKESGQMDDLVNNLRIYRQGYKDALAAIAAAFGIAADAQLIDCDADSQQMPEIEGFCVPAWEEVDRL